MLFVATLAWAVDPPAVEERTARVLAGADAHDGHADKVVGDCATCSLAMRGDAGHAATHEGYTLHFCSDACQRAFQKDPAKGIDRMEKALAKAR